jgi:hypothetical protein
MQWFLTAATNLVRNEAHCTPVAMHAGGRVSKGCATSSSRRPRSEVQQEHSETMSVAISPTQQHICWPTHYCDPGRPNNQDVVEKLNVPSHKSVWTTGYVGPLCDEVTDADRHACVHLASQRAHTRHAHAQGAKVLPCQQRCKGNKRTHLHNFSFPAAAISSQSPIPREIHLERPVPHQRTRLVRCHPPVESTQCRVTGPGPHRTWGTAGIP